jgi:hypothetical protein
VSRRVMEVIPQDHPNLAGFLTNLKVTLTRQFQRTERMKDLEEAIQVSQRAVEITPQDHPDLAH